MAKIVNVDQQAFAAWLVNKPKVILDLAARFPTDRLYRLKETGHYVTIGGYSEDGTLIAFVIDRLCVTDGEWAVKLGDNPIFGVPPGVVEECDLPQPTVPTVPGVGHEFVRTEYEVTGAMH